MKFNLFHRKKQKQSIGSSGYNIQGENNKIIIVEEDDTECELSKKETLDGLNIFIHGNDNQITIKKPYQKLSSCGIRVCANNSRIIIGRNVSIDSMWCEVCNGDNQFISIGDNCVILGLTIQACDEKAGFILEDSSLVSFNVVAWCSDAHSVILHDGTISNLIPKTIHIKEHCWIGYNATLYKNTKLEKNSVVAGSAVVTSAFDKEGIVIAGNPAKIIKENINWDIRNPHALEKIKTEG